MDKKVLDVYEKFWINFFQYKFHQEKLLKHVFHRLQVFVSVIFINTVYKKKSKIEDPFIFI